MIASLIYQCVPDPCDLQRSLERNRPQSHTTGRRDGRQEGCERGYYNLHRNLNNPLLHNCPLSIFNYQLRSISLYRGLRHHHHRHR